MTSLQAQDVEQYFSRYGWTIHSDGDNRWVTGWQGERQAFPLVVSYTETCLDFVVCPLLDVLIEWQNSPELLQLCAEINHEAKLVKLSIDHHERLTLSMQLLNSGLSYETFADAVGIIGYYAEHLYELLNCEIKAYGLPLRRSMPFLT